MRRGFAVGFALAVLGCAPVAPAPEVAEGNWLLPGTEWRLVALGGVPFTESVTATLTSDGRVTGAAPCNRFTAAYTGRWPDLSFSPVASTRRMCPDMEAETEFFAVLGRVNRAALGADGLVLTGPDDASLRFERVG